MRDTAIRFLAIIGVLPFVGILALIVIQAFTRTKRKR